MAWRIVGGLGGWLASLTPLIVVNALSLITAISPGVVPIAGGAGLILGIALGGLTAGLLGGKRGAGWGGTVAGAIAAALFAATLIGLMYALRAQSQLPYLLALHPIRTIGALGFVACLVMAGAAGVGALTGSRQAGLAAEAPVAQPARMPGQRASAPMSQPYMRSGESGRSPRASGQISRPAQPSSRSQRDSRAMADSHSRERQSRW